MKKYMYKHKWLFVGSSFAYFLSAIFQVTFAFLLGNTIDFILNHDLNGMFKTGFYTILIMAVSTITLVIGTYLKRKFTLKVMIDVKEAIADKVYRVSYNDYEKNDESYYLNLLSNDVHLLDQDYLFHITDLPLLIFEFIFSIISIMWISWQLTIGFSLLFLLPLLIPVLFSGRLQRYKERLSKDNETYTFCIKELIEGYESIKSNNAISIFLNRFRKDAIQRENSRYYSSCLEINSANVSSMLGGIAQIGCFIIGGVLVINGNLSVGLLMAAIQLLNSVFMPVTLISQSMAIITGIKPVIEKLNKFLDLKEEHNETTLSLKNADYYNINYDDISFGYDDQLIVKDFVQNFNHGKKYAVVGESGCGKSTITKLLMKYYSAYDGNIMINDQNIRELNTNQLYELISVVHQNTFIFNDTIMNNITMNKKYDPVFIQDVISRVNLNELLESHKDQPIGDFGKSISGGEKQRIAIARALLKQSKVIIFDEACASLDPNNAKAINDLILELKDITCIVITHDWSEDFLDRFDEVIKMKALDKASIVETVF